MNAGNGRVDLWCGDSETSVDGVDGPSVDGGDFCDGSVSESCTGFNWRWPEIEAPGSTVHRVVHGLREWLAAKQEGRARSRTPKGTRLSGLRPIGVTFTPAVTGIEPARLSIATRAHGPCVQARRADA
jgi:hypothetical protein